MSKTQKTTKNDRPVVTRKGSPCIGKFLEVDLTHEEFDKIRKKEDLKTTRQCIYYLRSQNNSMSGIAKFLNKRQQHVRNELLRETKKK